MRIAILSRRPSLYSTSRLKEAGKNRGHEMSVVDYLRCYMDITSRRPQVIYQGEPLQVDAIIPRIGASNTFYGTAVVRQFEMMGVFVANESQAISRSRDKLRSLQLLARDGVGLPVTGCAHSTKDIDGVISLAGGTPLVVKLIEGTQGVGVILAETKKAAQAVIEAFRGLDANILVQEFIKEAGGSDVRCFVVGGSVVATMKRQAGPGEFRSNLHRGGTAEKVKITPEERSHRRPRGPHDGAEHLRRRRAALQPRRRRDGSELARRVSKASRRRPASTWRARSSSSSKRTRRQGKQRDKGKG